MSNKLTTNRRGDSKSGSFGSEGSTPSLGTTQVRNKEHFTETEKKFLPNSCQEYPRGSGIKIREITNKHDGVSYKVTICDVYKLLYNTVQIAHCTFLKKFALRG